MAKEDAKRNQKTVQAEHRAAPSLALPTVIVDSQRRIVGANESWQTLLAMHGVNPALTRVGMDYFELLSNGLGAMIKPSNASDGGLEAVLAGRVEASSFSCHFSRDGISHHLAVNAGALAVGAGALITHQTGGGEGPTVQSATFGRDEDPTLLNRLLEETIEGVFLCSPSGELFMLNPSMAKWLGRSVSELLNRPVDEVLPPELSRLITDQNAETIAAGHTRTFEINAATVYGVRTFLVTKGVHSTPEGKVVGVFGIVRDISGIRAMEREIIDTSDKEKQRIGQELHENLCQYLVGISLLGNVLYEELLRLGLKQAEDARQITSLVKEAITEVRTLVKGLSTLPLEQEEGLTGALQELAEQARSIGRVKCRVRVPRSLHFISPAVAVHLFRIAQEAVHNAIKHSSATTIRITLANNRKAVVLTVQDDGIGYSSGHSIGDDTSSGLGLHIMNYRSRAIGATLDIRRIEGGGTAVVCHMPKV